MNIQFNFDAMENEEIIQNVKTILSTPVGSVPFDREFGIALDFIDKPVYQARKIQTVEIIRKVRRYEPRAKVERVIYSGDVADGQTISKVVIGLK
jgi:phage baseplate assembly protein W